MGPVPITPLEDPRERSARVKLTAGTFAGCGTSVGVGAGVLVLTTSLDVAVVVGVVSGGVGVLTHAAASSVAATAIADRRAPSPLLTRRASRLTRIRVSLVSTLARADLFWSTERVASASGDPRVRLIDCRFSFDEDMRSRYLEGHVPGAVYLSWAEDLSAPAPPSGHPRWMLQGGAAFARTMARFGIGDDTMVVGYDSEGGHHAARLWLALRRFGHDRMAVMEGGIQKWIAEGRPLESGSRSVEAPAIFTPRPREGVVASKEEVLAAVRSGDPWLLDVRRDSEFTGVEKRAARGGHVPGAVNILWKDALNDDWTLRDADELEEFYTNAGFGPETSTITYCQAGVRAAFTHLVLTALGHDQVRTYDGSWEEWGNDPALPIITGRS